VSRSLWWRVQVIANSAVLEILCADDFSADTASWLSKDATPFSGSKVCVYECWLEDQNINSRFYDGSLFNLFEYFSSFFTFRGSRLTFFY